MSRPWVPAGPQTAYAELPRAVDWGRHEFIVAGRRYPVQRQPWMIFCMLAAAGGGIVSYRAIVDRVYADDAAGGPLCAEDNVRVRMHYLRKICPWPIRNAHSVGYFIEGAPRPPRATPPSPKTVMGAGLHNLMSGR